MTILRILFACGVVLLGSVCYAQAPATLVATDTVRNLEFNEQVTLIGRTEAKATSRIVSEVAGRVEAINAGEGNWINSGGVLVTIDSDRIKLEWEVQKAAASEAETQLELAESNWKRTKELHDQELVRDITLDSARAWLAIAKANVTQSTSKRDQLGIDVANCRIKAPYDGYTLRRLVDVGEWVNPGTSVFEMVDLSQLTVVVDLPERLYGRLAIGSEVQLVASGDTEDPIVGVVTGIAPSASNETHTYPVIVKADNPDSRVGGGALVKATLSMKKRFVSLAVPKDAIVRQGMQTMIYTIHEGQAAPIPVIASATRGSMIAISGDGLMAGMPVVVRGNERIFPGSPVRTADETEAPPPPGAEEPASP